MSERAIARRYASALYEEASGTGIVDSVDEDVELLLATIRDSRDLRLFLASPVVSEERKEAVLSRLFKAHVSELVHSFLLLVTRKSREAMMNHILLAYRQLRLEQQGIVEAHARLASPMNAEDIAQLRELIGKTIGSKIELDVEEDPTLIGGVIVRVGDRVYDGSLKRQLAVLRRQLEGGAKIHTN